MGYEIIKSTTKDLTLPDHLYHATPIWNAQNILEGGLKVEFGRYQGRRQYQCIAEEAITASGFCDTVHFEEMRERISGEIVTFGFNLWLDPTMIDNLGDDPKYKGGLVTFRNFSPKAIDQIIISRAHPDREYQDFLRSCDNRTPSIPCTLTSSRI